jgi:GxxExxY protein
MNENDISYKIIGIAIELHTKLGPGLLESAYEYSLAYELRSAGMNVDQQVAMPFIYKDIKLECCYRIDLRVDNKVIVEVKSIENLAPVHFSQLLTYLKLSGCKLGLLINFNSFQLKDGIHRVVNGLYFSAFLNITINQLNVLRPLRSLSLRPLREILLQT